MDSMHYHRVYFHLVNIDIILSNWITASVGIGSLEETHRSGGTKFDFIIEFFQTTQYKHVQIKGPTLVNQPPLK